MSRPCKLGKVDDSLNQPLSHVLEDAVIGQSAVDPASLSLMHSTLYLLFSFPFNKKKIFVTVGIFLSSVYWPHAVIGQQCEFS